MRPITEVTDELGLDPGGNGTLRPLQGQDRTLGDTQ